MPSQITPAGLRPASRARSTAASVCPVRSSTPPGLAFSGKMWPGWTRSRGAERGSIATWTVRARSAAEMPVVTPSRASIETVNAVWKADSFFAAIRSSPSSSQRSGVSARQIRPRPCLAMKLIASGVANCAASVRSPSFSRFSSSQTTTMRPRRISSIASSIEEKGLCPSSSRRAGTAGSARIRRSVVNSGSFLRKALHETLRVAGDHVYLEVHAPSLPQLSQRGPLQRLRDQCDLESVFAEGRHGETDPLDRDRAALDHVAEQLGRCRYPQAPREAVLPEGGDRARAVHVPLNQVAAERLSGPKRGLEVDPASAP